jgi:ribonuclease VapC
MALAAEPSAVNASRLPERGGRITPLFLGKGRHPAGLNFGDCMAYAVTQAEGGPLLFAGEDFAKTDVRAAGQ